MKSELIAVNLLVPLTKELCKHLKDTYLDFSGGPVDKNPPANAGDIGPIPALGRFHTPRGN